MTRASSCLLERMACSISMGEPVLLVGETGTGKTSALQLLAKHTGNKLIVLNMNQHSDSADLIGGYKPLEFKIIVKPIRDKFEQLFRAEFNVEHNARFLNHVSVNLLIFLFLFLPCQNCSFYFYYCFRVVLITTHGLI